MLDKILLLPESPQHSHTDYSFVAVDVGRVPVVDASDFAYDWIVVAFDGFVGSVVECFVVHDRHRSNKIRQCPHLEQPL